MNRRAFDILHCLRAGLLGILMPAYTGGFLSLFFLALDRHTLYPWERNLGREARGI